MQRRSGIGVAVALDAGQRREKNEVEYEIYFKMHQTSVITYLASPVGYSSFVSQFIQALKILHD